MFDMSLDDLVLSTIIILLFAAIFCIYDLSIELKLLKEDISELRYLNKNQNKDL